MSNQISATVYTKVSAEYARKLAAGEIPQSTIPRTPTVEAAYEYHKAAIAAAGLTVGEYVRETVIKDSNRVIELSPFPYVCDVGIYHFLYWMRESYERVEAARHRMVDEYDGLKLEHVHVVRNTSQSVPEVPHYQVFVETNEDNILAPCYELPGQTRTLEEYKQEWEVLLGYPVELSYHDDHIDWQPADNIIKNGGTVRTFCVKRA